MNINEIFNIAYSKLYPEYPPNYPIPMLWNKANNIALQKVIKGWIKSNNKHVDKSHVVYVHIPYCISICKFCGFYREKLNSSDEIDFFIEKLAEEMHILELKEAFSKIKIKWLCIGGGTPSILNEKQIDKLFVAFHKNFNLNQTKVAFESSPPTLSLRKLKVLKENGVYFLSIGVQTFNEKLLQSMNRIQTKKQALLAIENAKKVGIKNIEVDLMVGLPGQTEEMFLNDINIVSKLDIERVYIFDFQPRFFTQASNRNSSLPLFSLEKWRNIRSKGIDILIKNGYLMRCGRWVYKREGEVWPYSYDQQEDDMYSILGLGPSSISYAMDAMRYQNTPDIKSYFKCLNAKKLPIEKIKFLTQKDEMKNMLMVKMMHTGKIDLYSFKQRFGKNLFHIFNKEIKTLTKAKLVLKRTDSLIAINRAKLQGALNTLLYSKSELIKLAKNLNLPFNPRIKKIIPVNNYIEYDNKIVNLSLKDKMKILSLIAMKKKLGYKELIFAISQKIHPAIITIYYNYAKKNNFEISAIITYKYFKRYFNRFPFKKTYIYAENFKLIKKTKNDIKNFILPYANNFKEFISSIKGIPKQSEIIFSQILSKPSYTKLNYKKIKEILPEIITLCKSRKIKFLFDDIPYCVIYPHIDIFYTFKEFKLGDRRESDANNIKLPQCLDCKYLLKCPGPDSKAIIESEEEIKPILK